ncbi:unnamed protein product, partial [Mesorhabditis belari]|uniref:Elongin-C n=1 Tax=Mesorhabditis belari TaxID=2138241 RepID=A0AAF3J4R6_9BILA
MPPTKTKKNEVNGDAREEKPVDSPSDSEADEQIIIEGPDANYVSLQSNDGHSFFIKKDMALVSSTIRAMLSGPGTFKEREENTIVFREVPSHVMQEVCRYFDYKHAYNQSVSEIPEFQIKPELALELLMVANFLDC